MRSGSVLGRTAGGTSEIGQAIRRELNSGAPEAFPSERKEIMTRTPFRSDNIAIVIQLHGHENGSRQESRVQPGLWCIFTGQASEKLNVVRELERTACGPKKPLGKPKPAAPRRSKSRKT